eukprot:TRINITY_DN4317_c0_g1_i1.p1 TRINITY_DN4317_c0_g1~~TRINITY_DN4317_c0_g1_i1.p1  ORF type:complete len:423 (-),score=98.12 TRINITY_DN4317_c0_g1_i1:43-1260(-)
MTMKSATPTEAECFPMYDELWSSGRVAAINPHLDVDAIHDFRETTWDRALSEVVWPVVRKTREIGSFESLECVDFSSNSSKTWNPFPGPETCFVDRNGGTLAVKCNFMLGYNSIFNLATSRCEDPSWVYEAFVEGLANYLTCYTIPEIQTASGSPKHFIRKFVVEWTRFKMLCTTLNGCFRYLDTYYAESNLLPVLVEACYVCFRKLVYIRFRLMILNCIQKLDFACTFGNHFQKEYDLAIQALCEIDHKTTNSITRGYFFNKDSRWLKMSLAVRVCLEEVLRFSVDDIHGLILSYVEWFEIDFGTASGDENEISEDEDEEDAENKRSDEGDEEDALMSVEEDEFFSVGQNVSLKRVHGNSYACQILQILADPQDPDDAKLKLSIRSGELLISRHSYRLEWNPAQ